MSTSKISKTIVENTKYEIKQNNYCKLSIENICNSKSKEKEDKKWSTSKESAMKDNLSSDEMRNAENTDRIIIEDEINQ